MSFFIYGYFRIIYQWIKYVFDETLEQIQKRIINVRNRKTALEISTPFLTSMQDFCYFLSYTK